MKMKKGQKVSMEFAFAGIISEEECTIDKVHKDKTVTLTNGFRFSLETGKCINDNDFGGASRNLRLE